MAKTELVDTSDFYGTADGVEHYIRNKDFSTSTDVSTSEVETKLKAASEWIDEVTKRAWRTRRVTDKTYKPKISHEQKRYYESSMVGRRTTPAGFFRPIDPWSIVNLQFQPIEDVTKVEVLLPASVNDITSDEDQTRADGSWHTDQGRGILYVDVGEFAVGPVQGGGIVPRPRVRVSFDYGYTGDVPEDIQDVAERLVAADLINSDAYGAVIGQGPDNVPDMTTGAQELFAGAMRTLKPYRGGNIL